MEQTGKIQQMITLYNIEIKITTKLTQEYIQKFFEGRGGG